MIIPPKRPWFAASVATFGVFAMINLASAGSIQILPGNTTSYFGWLINPDAGLSIVLDQSSTMQQINIEKFGVITNPELVGLNISFDQTSASASPIIKIADEHLLNSTGRVWAEFDMLLIGLGGVSPTFTSTFFSTDVMPFTTSTIVNGQKLVLAGGLLPSSSNASGTITWGAVDGPSNAITISTNPGLTQSSFSHFVLKEVAGPGPAIPVPAAAWTGLSGLAGLALVSLSRKVGTLLT